MPDTLSLRPFQGEDDYALLAAILTASEQADHLAITFSAEALAELMQSAPRFDLLRDLVITEGEGQAVGCGNVRWWEDPTRRGYTEGPAPCRPGSAAGWSGL